MSEQGYNKARALACIDRAVTDLPNLRRWIEGLPDALSAKDGTDMDAFDCSRFAGDISDRCKEIGLALGLVEIIDETPTYELHGVEIDDDLPF